MDDRSVIPAHGDTEAPRFRRVCVATDFSKGSMRAVRRVARLRLGAGALVRLVHVLPRELAADRHDAALREARKALEQLAQETGEQARHAGNMAPQIEPVVTVGQPAAEIVRVAREMDAELIVFGRHGRTTLGGMLLGSTAERVIRSAAIAVLVVTCDPRKPYRKPLMATDLSGASRATMELLLRLCEPRSKINLVHVSERPYAGFVFPPLSPKERAEERQQAKAAAMPRAKALVEPYERAGVSFRIIVRGGDPRMVICQQVALRRADLVALAAHGRSGLSHALLGSVTEWVAREVASDVLIARPQPEDFKQPI